MASANVDLVRSIFEGWERGDFSSTEWAESWRRFLGVWDRWSVGADEYRELDDERVLVLSRRRGRGKTSGLDLEKVQTQGAALFHVRGGKVARLAIYADREHALADLGLDPEAHAADS
jgi:ketosteroid isomerase-like protein